MKPNFALSLSFEGIGLLHRAFPGWNRVGEVALDSPDLPGALAVLRETAQQINGKDIHSKLVIPNDQIKYLTLDLGVMTEDQRHAQIVELLDGATPYPVDELAFDWSFDGTRTHVAAVARETLAEAEDFAQSHGFGPLSFVAIPPDGQFSGEPFFGPTAHAARLLGDGEQVQRDMAPIRVTGIARLPDPEEEPASEPAAPAAEEASANEAGPEAAAPQDAPEPAVQDTAGAPPLSAEDEEAPASAPVFGHAESDAETADADNPGEPAETGSAGAEPENTPAPEEPGEPEAAPAFATIRASRDDAEPTAPRGLSGVRRDAADLTAPSIPIDEEDDAPREEHDAAVIPAPAPTIPLHEDDDIPPMPGYLQARDALAAQRGDEAPGSDVRESRLAFFSRRGAEMASGMRESLSARAARRASERAEAEAQAEAEFETRTEPSLIPPAPPPFVDHSAHDPREAERQRMTVFGARQAEARTVGGKPRHLGLILTLVLLAFLAAIAAWASFFTDDGLSRLFGPRSTPDTNIATLPADAPDETAVEGDEAMVPDTDQVTGDTEPETALAEPAPEPAPVAAPAPIQPALPHLLTEKEAQARYAVTGVWQRAPTAPQLPDQLSLDDLYLTSLDPRVDAQDAVALPSGKAQETDLAMAVTPQTARRGARFTFDARGLVPATPEGAPTPEGHLAFAGRPPLVPPLREAAEPTPDPAEAVAAAQRAGIRPKARPEGLYEENERFSLGGRTRAELAAFRPRERPTAVTAAAAAAAEAAAKEAAAAEAAALAAASTAALPATEVSAGTSDAIAAALAAATASGTEQAVAQSVKPRPRPSNFSRLVERTRTIDERGDGSEVTQVAAAVPRQQATAPSVPSKANVAKAATVPNQLNLRKVNLIGVYGKPSSRRALVRLANGRYKKVQVGDRLDGGQVRAIGDGELRYTKSGRDVILKMPRG